MKVSTLGAIATVTLALSAGSASAAGIGGGFGALQGASNSIIEVHGVHRSCELGPAGWHRSPRPGVRIACRPPRPRGAHWIWRHDGPKFGWYHSRERRWWR
ncbi:MAG: hypothetical protein ACK4MF_01710 [Hyphomicrobiaceae bacterium]